MAAEEASLPATRVEEADEYLRKHRILDLFNNLTSQLIYARPGTYISFSLTMGSRKRTQSFANANTSNSNTNTVTLTLTAPSLNKK